MFGTLLFGDAVFATTDAPSIRFTGWDEICPTDSTWLAVAQTATAWPEVAIKTSTWVETLKTDTIVRNCE